MQTYSHSGTVPVGAAVKTILAGMVAAAIGGVIYAYAFYWIPFVYLNFLATLCFAGAIGFTIAVMAERGKIRNNSFLRVITILIVLLGMYVYWGAYAWALIGIDKVGLGAFHPRVLVSFAEHLFEKGSWGITRGEIVTGWFLVAFWIAELAVVLWFAVTMAMANAHLPFCEACDTWTEEEKDKVRLAATGDEPAWQEVFAGDLPSLAAFTPAARDAKEFVRLNTARCPRCEQSRFLTATAVKIKVDKKGNESEIEKRLITNGILTPAQFAVVEACAELFNAGPAAETGDSGEEAPAAEGGPLETDHDGTS